jgi:hypothetical protein
MTTLTLQAPMPLHTYQTRGGTVVSDASGIITDVPVPSQLLADLISAGCAVIPNSAPTDSLQDPIE